MTLPTSRTVPALLVIFTLILRLDGKTLLMVKRGFTRPGSAAPTAALTSVWVVPGAYTPAFEPVAKAPAGEATVTAPSGSLSPMKRLKPSCVPAPVATRLPLLRATLPAVSEPCTNTVLILATKVCTESCQGLNDTLPAYAAPFGLVPNTLRVLIFPGPTGSITGPVNTVRSFSTVASVAALLVAATVIANTDDSEVPRKAGVLEFKLP